MQKRFKVVWICHFTNIEIQTKLPLWKKFNEFGSWIINAIAGFEKHDDIELHIVAPHIYLKRDTHFILRGINYHFLSFGFPIINRPWPSFFALDAICFYPFLTRKIQKTVKRINPDILVLQAAGIRNGQDVYKVIKAGADATGTTSGIMKAENPEAMLDEMIRAVRTAWDEIHA